MSDNKGPRILMRFKTKDGLYSPIQEMSAYRPSIKNALKTSVRVMEHEGSPSFAPLNCREYVEKRRETVILFEYEEV